MRGRGGPTWRTAGLLAVLAMLAATLAATLVVLGDERSRARAEREAVAVGAGAALSTQLRSSIEQVRAVQALLEISPALSAAQFASFAEVLNLQPGLLALSWHPRVASGDRARFERASGARIAELDRRGNPRPTGRRPEHFPVRFVERRAPTVSPVGLDLGADPELARALRKARDAGASRVSGQVTLTGGGRGMVIVEPVYATIEVPGSIAARRSALMGFAVGTFRAKALADAVAPELPAGTVLRILDGSAQIHGPAGPRPGDADERAITLGGRTWRVLITGGAGVSWAEPAAIAGAGLALSLLIGALVVSGARRERHTAGVVASRLGEREAAVADLRASEERFRSVVDSARDAIILTDAAGGIVSWNGAATQILGYAPDELIGKPMGILLPRAERHRVIRLLRARAEGRQTGQAIELEARRSDGSLVPVEVTLASWGTADGRLYSGILRDVSERRNAQRQLEQGRHFLGAALASLDEGIIACDADGEVVLFNRALRELHGLAEVPTAEEVWDLRRHIRDADGVTPLAEDELPLVRALRGEALSELETVVVRDGERRNVLASGRPILDTGGRQLGAVVSLRDVTERVRAERALRRERDFSDSLVASMQDGVLTVDGGGVVEHVNPRFCEMTGFRPEELVGTHPPHPHWPPEEAERLSLLRARLATGARQEHDAILMRADGSRFPVIVTGSPRGRDEDHDGYVLMVKDITERKRREAEQAALRRVAVAVAGESDEGEALGLIAEEAARIFGVEAAGVLRFEDGVDRAILMGIWTAGGSVPPLGTTMPMPPDTVGAHVLETGRPGRWEAPEGQSYTAPALRDPYLSAVATPVRLFGRLWGTLSVGSTRRAAFPPGAEHALSSFAELATLALANAHSREELVNLASTDHLTGLPNRRSFQERLASEVERSRRHGRPLSLVVFDIDHFKRINDTLGHQAGDRVLKEVAERLSRIVRGGETLARVGGEEFAWLLPDADGMGAFAAAERARAAIAGAPCEGFPVTTSAGISDLAQAADGAELFRLADLALYWAKTQGRNLVVRCSPDTLEVLSAGEQEQRVRRAQALSAIRVLAQAVDAKDPSTQRHSERVATLAERLALASGWSPARAVLLREAGLVHDVGKIGVPDALLLKPGRLSGEEYEQVKDHAALGAEMVAEVLSGEQTAWVRSHHERFTGGGYPDGLAGEAIPDGARLLALADAWDAMTVARPYGSTREPSEALAECRAECGRQFAPETVAALERLVGEGLLETPAVSLELVE